MTFLTHFILGSLVALHACFPLNLSKWLNYVYLRGLCVDINRVFLVFNQRIFFDCVLDDDFLVFLIASYLIRSKLYWFVELVVIHC